MEIFTWISEERIAEAFREGKFDDLPGQGQPIDLSDDDHIPPEMRLIFRIMKNAEITPKEVSLRNEINKLKAELKTITIAEERARLQRELQWLYLKLVEK
ncbi:MAG: DUF1992 domain-containing protein [Blastocatellia bacterium]|nr:DUF1992 domain-containing protein [Blastocatellia bacterium]MBL8196492.1 DUF1992 domain-containing protein [Blastocatellia bacterium]MBN8722632.1 DUF1992 domain-containing protein [Acidobacteriota bacterium]